MDFWDALKKARNLLTFCVSRSLRQVNLSFTYNHWNNHVYAQFEGANY